MIKNILTRIGGVENYGIISILIFFTFFLGVLLWAFSRRKEYLVSMATLPLDDEERTKNHNIKNSNHN
jgi:cbb3-type cytochrome oxidase subunit 3